MEKSILVSRVEHSSPIYLAFGRGRLTAKLSDCASANDKSRRASKLLWSRAAREGGAAADRVRPGVISGIADGWDGIHAISDPFHRPLLPLPSCSLSLPLGCPIPNCGLYFAHLDLITRTKDLIATDGGGGGGSGVAITVSQRRANFRGWL